MEDRKTPAATSRNSRFDCDLALIELSESLLDGVRDRLSGIQKIEGEWLTTERGTWQSKTILLAQLKPSASYSLALESILVTHHPKSWFLVGVGRSESNTLTEETLAYVSKVIFDQSEMPLGDLLQKNKYFANEIPYVTLLLHDPTYLQAENKELVLTADWETKLIEAFDRLGVEGQLLVAISNGQARGRYEASSQEASLARQAGRFWGRLQRPKSLWSHSRKTNAYWQWQRRLADKIEVLIQRIT